MKSKVLRLIENAISGAYDNAYRAKLKFGNMSSQELDQEYGESGRKCRDILEEYVQAEKDAQEMRQWFLEHCKD